MNLTPWTLISLLSPKQPQRTRTFVILVMLWIKIAKCEFIIAEIAADEETPIFFI